LIGLSLKVLATERNEIWVLGFLIHFEKMDLRDINAVSDER